MNLNPVLLGAMREYREEFRDFSKQVKQDCKDADASRNEARDIVYRHFLGKDDSLPMYFNFQRFGQVREDIAQGRKGKWAGGALIFREIGYIGAKLLVNEARQLIQREFLSNKTKEGEDLTHVRIRSKAKENRRYMEDPVTFRQEEVEEREKSEALFEKEPWYIRLTVRPLFRYLQRPFEL